MNALKSTVILLAVLMVTLGSSRACCSVWNSQVAPVEIAAQEVLIYWDSKNGIEHFVRRADFDAEKLPDDFGFLVPTPTQPKLSEAPDQVFLELDEMIKPEVRVEKIKRMSFKPLSVLFFESMAKGGDSKYQIARMLSSEVEVLDIAFVGGYEAVVLRAAEVDSLLGWLKKNDYDARPELRNWLAPYVEKKWVVTAFKYACEPDRGPRSLSREAVCMSFATDAPFFPYRVPSDLRVKPEDGSLLRLYFAGDERVSGNFESGDERAWGAIMKFSNRVEGVDRIFDGLAGMAKDDVDFPKSTWLTSFEDSTWPGGAEDLYFTPSADATAVTPSPIIQQDVSYARIPADVVLGTLFFGYIWFRKRVKNRMAITRSE